VCLLIGCHIYTRQQYACEGDDMYISCGQFAIHVVDANYGRSDNSMCADQLGTPNDNCQQDVTCIVQKWFVLLSAGKLSIVMSLFVVCLSVCLSTQVSQA